MRSMRAFSEFVARGAGDAEFHAELGAGDHEGAGDVVAVADVGEGESAEFAEMLLGGHEVGHGLAGVGVIGEAVDDGDGGVSGEFEELGVFEDAAHDAVAHAREHASDIGDALAFAQADFGGGDVESGAAEVGHGDLKADTRAQGGLFEDHGEGLAGEQRIVTAGLAVLVLEANRFVQDVAEGLRGGGGEGDEVEFWRGHGKIRCWVNGK